MQVSSGFTLPKGTYHPTLVWIATQKQPHPRMAPSQVPAAGRHSLHILVAPGPGRLCQQLTFHPCQAAPEQLPVHPPLLAAAL